MRPQHTVIRLALTFLAGAYLGVAWAIRTIDTITTTGQ